MKRMQILGLAIDNSRIGFKRYVWSHNGPNGTRMMESYVTSVKLNELADASRVAESGFHHYHFFISF